MRGETRTKRKSMPEYVMSLATAAVILSAIFVPREIKNKAVIACACAALPEGGRAYIREALFNLPETAVISETADLSAQRQTEISDERSGDAAETPKDILKLMEDAKKSSADDKKDGSIKPWTYGKSSATSIFGNVLVRNATDTKAINIEKVLKEGTDLKIKDKSKPSVLIYHTHTTEGFELLDRDWYAADKSSRTADSSRNIVRVGKEIAKELEAAGFNVIHDETIHDLKYSGAYDRSRETVRKHLEKHPEIQVTIDVHRDAIQENDGTKIKPISEIGGKKSAQVMIITGAQEGTVKDFQNWESNLKFALGLQKSCEDMSPGLMRPVFFCQRKYNMDMTKYSLLVEVGSEANTLEEAAYAGRLFGRGLAALLEKHVST